MKIFEGISILILSFFLSFFLILSILTYTPDSRLKYNSHVSAVGVINRVKILSNDDIICLARNIYFEARNESVLGQHAVAWVTLNRVKHHKWPDTVCEVVYQRKQFSWTIKNKDKKTYNKEAYKRSILIAKDTLNEYNVNGEDLSNGALYYHADYVKPIWRKNLFKIAQIDTHIFYKHK